MHDFDTLLEEVRRQLDTSRQNWLFGAGISYLSNIPLMAALTSRVSEIIKVSALPKDIEVYNCLVSELDEKSHVEHYLSHLGDLLAIADRSKHKSVTLGEHTFFHKELLTTYNVIISAIGNTVRYGYTKGIGSEPDVVGTSTAPIVKLEHHDRFIKAVFGNRSNLMSRSKLTFFTTNYDTLLEDALAYNKLIVTDGFSGGAVAFWNPNIEFNELDKSPQRCILYKLHGSIDWYRDTSKGLLRVRYLTNYLSDPSNIMIYPQATKYVETQKDPFSYLFNGLRSALQFNGDNIVVTCGYSFGDEHINLELETALENISTNVTLIAFVKECPEKDVVVHPTLDRWLQNKIYCRKVYVCGEKGIYNGSLTAVSPEKAEDLNWWTFSGLTDFLSL